MGYTHYWNLARTITIEEMAQIAKDAEAIILASELPIGSWDGSGAPELTDRRVSFNGLGENAHETFALDRIKTGFRFCKTARKPYDVVVTATLLAAKDILKGTIALSSDGDTVDWIAGRALAERATGRTLNPFQS